MRTIKFRAWDKDNKCMIVQSTKKMMPIGDLSDQADEYRYELMQFIGLTDKNRKECFEDDIIRANVIDIRGCSNEIVGKVFYSEFEYCIETEIYDWPVISLECIESFEIIGNIYENLELLEAE